MPFNRPLLTDLINRVRNDVVSRLTNPDLLRRTNAEAYTKALSGAVHGLYGNLDWLANQLIYDTAETTLLERWASIWGITRNNATQAVGFAVFTGSNGATIPAGTLLTAYDGVTYTTNTLSIISGTTATAAITSVSAGLISNRTAGQTLTTQSPITGVSASVVAGALTGGSDIESDNALRARFLTRIKQPPQGGSKTDYANWAMAVPGVTRVWVSPLELGAGTVVVRFMMDTTYSNGIPLSGDVTTVYNALAVLKPVTTNLTVVAPIANPLNFTITGLSPGNATVQAAVTQSLTDLISKEAVPGGTLLLSHINEAIAIAYGETDHVLTLPANNVVNTTGYITTMGVITWA